MNTRRDFMKQSGGALLAVTVIGGTTLLEGCTLSSALTEANNILKLIAPLGDGIASIVEIADPPLALVVAAATKLYDAGVVAVENLLSSWAAASAAAQPGILSQAQAAVVALQQNAAALIAAAQVKDPTSAAEIQTITGAITSEIGAILSVIPQIGALGGTTAAAKTFMKHRWVQLSGQQSSHVWRGSLVKHLAKPTNSPIDGARTALAAKLNALSL